VSCTTHRGDRNRARGVLDYLPPDLGAYRDDGGLVPRALRVSRNSPNRAGDGAQPRRAAATKHAEWHRLAAERARRQRRSVHQRATAGFKTPRLLWSRKTGRRGSAPGTAARSGRETGADRAAGAYEQEVASRWRALPGADQLEWMRASPTAELAVQPYSRSSAHECADQTAAQREGPPEGNMRSCSTRSSLAGGGGPLLVVRWQAGSWSE